MNINSSGSIPPLLILSTSQDLTCAWSLHNRSTVASYREVLPLVNGVITVGGAPSIGGQSSPDYFVTAQANRAGVNIYTFGRDTPLFKCATQEPLTCLASSSPGCGVIGSKGSFPAFIVGGASSGKLYLWDLTTGDLLRVWQAHYKAVTTIAFSRCSGLIVSGGLDCAIHAWDVTALLDVALLSDPTRLPTTISSWTSHSLPITHVSVMHGSGGGIAQFFILSSSLDRTIRISTITNQYSESGQGREISSTSSSSSLVCVTLPAAISAMTLDSLESILYAGCVNGTIYPLSISDMMTLSSEDNTERGNGVELMFQDLSSAFLGHRATVSSLCLTPDNQILISSGDDHAIHVWDCLSKQRLSSFESHKSSVSSVIVMRRPYSLAPALQVSSSKSGNSTSSSSSSSSSATPVQQQIQQQIQQQHKLSGPPPCSIAPLRKHAVVMPAIWRGSSTGPLSGVGTVGSGPVRYFAGGISSEAGLEEKKLADAADILLLQSLSTLLTLEQQFQVRKIEQDEAAAAAAAASNIEQVDEEEEGNDNDGIEEEVDESKPEENEKEEVEEENEKVLDDEVEQPVRKKRKNKTR